MKKIIMVLSKRPLETELDPFKMDPELALINKAMLISKKPQILEGIEGIIFHHDLDSLEIKDIIKTMPSEICMVRTMPYNRFDIEIISITRSFDLESSIEKIRELLG